MIRISSLRISTKLFLKKYWIKPYKLIKPNKLIKHYKII